ncbi:efflux RND transporter periplasmic adaptor subunit [Syntrophobacter fumaroxidans]|uniref:Secretion protein HlyD family protein n=1 Tax=Syntrophobacter fumaroxidans (strain DSM 10017 / MPOB) TaxID=335543 RepID=A0LPJ8_SYNFM|nr:secretion protein HlyD family protein [Syntrophobacter fumaroxidans MPOB]
MQMNKTVGESLKLIVFLMILSGGLLTGGCGRGKSSAPPPAVPEVSVVAVQPEQVVLTVELPGRTAPHLVAEIRPQVNGIIQKRLFKEGSDVKAGQVLYQIDPASFQAALDNAKASLARAEANRPAIRLRVERYKELLADKAVSRQDHDDAVASLKQADAEVELWKAAVESARINLGYTRVMAPISGRIGRSNVTDGALVTAHQATPLATIQQLDPIFVDVPQSTTELLRLRRRWEDGRLNPNGTNQKKVKLLLEDGTPYPPEGTLQFREVTVDPTTGSVILRAVFPNPEGVLLPGMYVRAVVQEGIHEQAILIPQQTVMRDPKGNPSVMIVDAEGKVQQRPLTLERAIGDKWLVSAGLASGERVIVEGIQKVRPGASVKVVSAEGDGQQGVAVRGNASQPAVKLN